MIIAMDALGSHHIYECVHIHFPNDPQHLRHLVSIDDGIDDILWLMGVGTFGLEHGGAVMGDGHDAVRHGLRTFRYDKYGLSCVALIEGIEHLGLHELIDNGVKRTVHTKKHSGYKYQCHIGSHDIVPCAYALLHGEIHGKEIRSAGTCSCIQYQYQCKAVYQSSEYRYEQKRREKEQKKKQKVIEVKEVRLSPNIDTNDLNTKINAARKFLEKGNKIKVNLRFRGRELSRMMQSTYILDDFAEKLSDVAAVDRQAKAEGRSLVLILSPKKS